MKRFPMGLAATAVLSSVITYLLTGAPRGNGGIAQAIAAEKPPAASTAPESTKLTIDEHDMRWVSVNAYRIHTTAEEVVIDLGFNMLDPNPQPGGQAMLFHVFGRNVMSSSTAKRLQQSLTRLIDKYQASYGEIKLPEPAK